MSDFVKLINVFDTLINFFDYFSNFCLMSYTAEKKESFLKIKRVLLNKLGY